MALIIPHNLIIHSFAQGPCGCVQRPQTSSQTSFPQKSKRSVQSGCVKHNVQNMVPRGQEHASIWKHQSFRKLCVELDQLPLVFSKEFFVSQLFTSGDDQNRWHKSSLFGAQEPDRWVSLGWANVERSPPMGTSGWLQRASLQLEPSRKLWSSYRLAGIQGSKGPAIWRVFLTSCMFTHHDSVAETPRSSAHAHGRHDCQVTRSSHGRRGPPTSKSHYSWSCHPPTGIAGELIQRLASKLLNFQFCNMLNDANPFFLQGHQRVCPVCGQHIAAYIYNS